MSIPFLIGKSLPKSRRPFMRINGGPGLTSAQLPSKCMGIFTTPAVLTSRTTTLRSLWHDVRAPAHARKRQARRGRHCSRFGALASAVRTRCGEEVCIDCIFQQLVYVFDTLTLHGAGRTSETRGAGHHQHRGPEDQVHRLPLQDRVRHRRLRRMRGARPQARTGTVATVRGPTAGMEGYGESA